jgi:ribosomal protein S14
MSHTSQFLDLSAMVKLCAEKHGVKPPHIGTCAACGDHIALLPHDSAICRQCARTAAAARPGPQLAAQLATAPRGRKRRQTPQGGQAA